jgi:hypothetical protein
MAEPTRKKARLKLYQLALIVESQWNRFTVHYLIFEMLELKYSGCSSVQVSNVDLTNLLIFVLTEHIDVGCLAQMAALQSAVEHPCSE